MSKQKNQMNRMQEPVDFQEEFMSDFREELMLQEVEVTQEEPRMSQTPIEDKEEPTLSISLTDFRIVSESIDFILINVQGRRPFRLPKKYINLAETVLHDEPEKSLMVLELPMEMLLGLLSKQKEDGITANVGMDDNMLIFEFPIEDIFRILSNEVKKEQQKIMQ